MIAMDTLTTATSSPARWLWLWDGRRWPGWEIDGMPAFGYAAAPSGLLTRRQLRDADLCPGGHEPYARLAWQRGRRWAWLWRADLARPKRTATAAQLAAVNAALRARRVCAVCGPVDHCVRTTDRLCGDCHVAGVTPPASAEPPAWRVIQDLERAA